MFSENVFLVNLIPSCGEEERAWPGNYRVQEEDDEKAYCGGVHEDFILSHY